MAVVIREDMEQYMRELREWLEQEKDTPLEEMAGFFQRRIGSYAVSYTHLWGGGHAGRGTVRPGG